MQVYLTKPFFSDEGRFYEEGYADLPEGQIPSTALRDRPEDEEAAVAPLTDTFSALMKAPSAPTATEQLKAKKAEPKPATDDDED